MILTVCLLFFFPIFFINNFPLSLHLQDIDRTFDDLSFALKNGLLYMQDPINKVK